MEKRSSLRPLEFTSLTKDRSPEVGHFRDHDVYIKEARPHLPNGNRALLPLSAILCHDRFAGFGFGPGGSEPGLIA
jgi:hypothetical protein